ncbi:uncharacterized protein LOC141930940 [Strix aluco]|uniref:uncharacterized protein LOC141930940 n=1 Tax=Strix aluco TaxID=111821 RepID=UPI003DA3760B
MRMDSGACSLKVPSARLCGNPWALCMAHAPWALCSAADAGPSGSPEQILERGLPERTNASEGGAGAGPVAKHLPWLPVRKADTVGVCGAAMLPRHTVQSRISAPEVTRARWYPGLNVATGKCQRQGATCRLGGAKLRAAEQSRTARQLSAGSGFLCRESRGSSMKHFSLVLQEPGTLPLESAERLRCHGPRWPQRPTLDSAQSS